MNKTLAWLLAGAALTLTAGAAVAHDAADEARAQARQDAVERRVHIHRGGPRKNVAIYRSGEGREERLKDVLQLRPDQEPALKAFLAATGTERGERDHLVRFDRDARQPTAERLAEMEARADEHHAAMKARIAATRAFYGQLDASQKKAFDAMPMLMMAGPGFGPTLIPVGHPLPPRPPRPPLPPAPPEDLSEDLPGDV